MAVKVAINGFGRIGRCVVRQLLLRKGGSPFEIVAINDLTDTKTLAHLLKYDSVHGRANFTVEAASDGKSITVNGHKIAVSAEKDPSKLPWGALGVTVALECTGIFTSREKAAMHLTAGAKKVIISAPAADADATIVVGVNDTTYAADKHNVISCGSCTTNCLAPVAKVLNDTFGIVHGMMTTAHSYTNDQQILDLPHKDLRRARAAALSMIPTTTGAAKAIGLVLPELKGKLDGFAIRVPTPCVSVVDLVVSLKKEASVADVNNALKAAATSGPMSGVLDYSDEPLVSVDYIGAPASSTVDALSTMVIDGKLVKVVAWYDNEVGFSNRMIDLVSLISS